jgi:hypothetical protein
MAGFDTSCYIFKTKSGAMPGIELIYENDAKIGA